MGAVPSLRTEKWKNLSALDRSFLVAESRDVMMHVGGLLEFSPTRWAVSEDQLREELASGPEVQLPWNVRLSHPDLLKSPVQAWLPDAGFELDYHVRRLALPSPGDERELGMLVSRLHSTPLDFHRPPWEVNFIEGLRSDRLAIYLKIHHSLLDGYTGMRMLSRSLSTDPTDRRTPLFFTIPPERARKEQGERGDEPVPTLEALLGAARDQVGVAKDISRALVDVVRRRRAGENGRILSLQAPRSILNQRITCSRRLATQQLSLERVKTIACSSAGTVNDVMLAICSVALRRFLLEQGELPDRPLIALVPVNVRPKDDPGGGNAVGAILATLATDKEDPRSALDAIIASTTRGKTQLQGMSGNAIVQYSALVLAPMILSFLPGAAGRVRPAFNVVISNVPGPQMPLYFRGWRLDESYPLSIPFHGYGLNITVQSYAGLLNFGIIGCRDTLPHLQRLAVYSAEALEALGR
jgi:diacylglycerol O-acyltransferase / wax synthase